MALPWPSLWGTDCQMDRRATLTHDQFHQRSRPPFGGSKANSQHQVNPSADGVIESCGVGRLRGQHRSWAHVPGRSWGDPLWQVGARRFSFRPCPAKRRTLIVADLIGFHWLVMMNEAAAWICSGKFWWCNIFQWSILLRWIIASRCSLFRSFFNCIYVFQTACLILPRALQFSCAVSIFRIMKFNFECHDWMYQLTLFVDVILCFVCTVDPNITSVMFGSRFAFVDSLVDSTSGAQNSSLHYHLLGPLAHA